MRQDDAPVPYIHPRATPYAVDLGLGQAGFESLIATEEFEVAAAFDQDGGFLLRPRIGGADAVDFYDEEIALLRGSVVTHNHPDGNVFSGEDAAFASEHGLLEMRAVLSDGIVYSLRKPFDEWPALEAMRRAAESFIEPFLSENRSRRTRRQPIMNRREESAFMFDTQRRAFAEIGVEMRRTSVWA